MKAIQLLTFTAFLHIAFGTADLHAQDLPAKVKEGKRDEVFGPEKLWTVHLQFSANEYGAMAPKGGGFPFGGFFPKKGDAPPKKIEEPKEKQEPAREVHKSKGFGMEFPWAKADLTFEKVLLKDVGIRYTGNSTYNSSASGLKRPYKVDVNHFIEDQKLFGMNGFNLRNNVMDPTRIREPLAYSIYRSAQVPAPRTAFARVYLTVPEKHDRAYLGVYTLVEPVDKTFLKRHFGSDKGMLLKPERVQGIPYLGEKWESYAEKFNPKREPDEAQKRRLIEFAKLINHAEDARFAKEIAEYLDVDNFLRYAAVTSLTGNLDSFLGLGHNYFLYLNPKTNRFHFIPWDLDLSFGGFGFGGDQIEWSIAQPYMGKNRLAERVLAQKEYATRYRGHLKALTNGAFRLEVLKGQIAQLEATVKEAIAQEPAGKAIGFGFGPPGGKKQDLRDFVARRAESVVAQLEGRSQGKPIAGFGFGGFKGGGFAFGKNLAKPILDVADTNKDAKISLEEFQVAAGKLFKESGGSEQKAITESDLIDVINRLMPPPPGFGGLKPPPPPKGFGPGKGIAAAILNHGGAGEERTLSLTQLRAGAKKLFHQWDKDRNGSLDEKELADGLSQFIPPPALFGPPPDFGPPPADPRKGPLEKDLSKEKK